MLLNYSRNFNEVFLYLKLKIEQIKYYIQIFNFFKIFSKKVRFPFLRKFPKISAENLHSDFRNIRTQNNFKKYMAFYCIWSYLSFGVSFLMVWEPRTLQKFLWKFFLDYFCNSRKLIFWTEPYIFWILNLQLMSKWL